MCHLHTISLNTKPHGQHASSTVDTTIPKKKKKRLEKDASHVGLALNAQEPTHESISTFGHSNFVSGRSPTVVSTLDSKSIVKASKRPRTAIEAMDSELRVDLPTSSVKPQSHGEAAHILSEMTFLFMYCHKLAYVTPNPPKSRRNLKV